MTASFSSCGSGSHLRGGLATGRSFGVLRGCWVIDVVRLCVALSELGSSAGNRTGA